MFSEIYLWTKPLIVKSTLSPNKNYFRHQLYCTPEKPDISISFLFAFLLFQNWRKLQGMIPQIPLLMSNHVTNLAESTPVLAGSRHDPYQRRSAFTWADNLVIMFMQFYTEFHKVAMGCRPILDLDKHLYKHRKIANVGLLSLTGQQK